MKFRIVNSFSFEEIYDVEAASLDEAFDLVNGSTTIQPNITTKDSMQSQEGYEVE